MSRIVKRPPYPGGSSFQRFNNFGYLQLARAIAQLLGRSDEIRSIFIRRSLAAGEVFPPFSDIDLSAILHSPLNEKDGPERLARLYGKFRRLRLALPILGEIEMTTTEEFAWWGRVEPYRHSLNARVGILVFGEPIATEDCPVTSPSAVRRLIFWFEMFISQAMRTGNKRNLRKFALEFWNARACATGRIDQPFITRRESEADWRAATGDDSFPPELGLSVRASASACLDQVKKLHDALLPPLSPQSEPLVYEDLLWPVAEHRCFVVLPHAQAAWPDEVARPDSFVCTPEVLNLYVHFCNPFKYWTLPNALRDLGIAEPTRETWAEGCRYSLEPHKAREPGFSARDVHVLARYWVINQVIAQMKAGGVPVPPDLGETRRRRESGLDYPSYYREAYAETYALGVEAREGLHSI